MFKIRDREGGQTRLLLQALRGSLRDGDGRAEGVEGVGEQRVVGGDEAPLVLLDVVDLAGHVVVAADHVDLVLQEEGLVAHAQLVHVVHRLPVLAVHVEQVHLPVPVRVLASDEQDFAVGDGDGAAGPQGVLHAHSQHLPLVLVHFVHLDAVVDLLLRAPEEPSEGVDELVGDGAGAQVMPLVLHGSHLSPGVLPDVVLLDRAEPLLS
mmetsp:Transcript_13690/g.23336  ORF Transcript_13690/g.23336 Transcript_13690/m.23336 type:complete len:208 (-) Transcript_13690:1348-1971(-)